FVQAEDGIRDRNVTGVQTCAFRSILHPHHRHAPGAPGACADHGHHHHGTALDLYHGGVPACGVDLLELSAYPPLGGLDVVGSVCVARCHVTRNTPRLTIVPWCDTGLGRNPPNRSNEKSMNDETEYRIEHDTMGEVRVPKNATYRAQTQRAVENFQISDSVLSRHHI